MRFHHTNSWCVCVCVLLCVVIWFYVVFIVCVFSQGSYTLLPLRVPEQQHASSLQMPQGEEGEGGWQWHKCPIVRAASLPLEETITWGHQKISYDINPASLVPPNACTYARIRTPTHNPSVTNHFPFSWATPDKATDHVCGLYAAHVSLVRSFTPSSLPLTGQKLLWVLWSHLIMSSITCACMC